MKLFNVAKSNILVLYSNKNSITQFPKPAKESEPPPKCHAASTNSALNYS